MNKTALFFLAGSHFVTDLNLGSLPAVLPFFVSVYGFDYASVAGLLFASSCLSTVVQPLFGYLADRTNQRWFMGAGLLVCGLSFAACGYFTSYWAIFSAILLSGIGSAVFHPQAAKFVNAVSAEKRATGMSCFSVGGNGGFGVGPLLAVALISAFGMKGLFLYGAMSLAVGVPLLLYAGRLQGGKAASPARSMTQKNVVGSDAENDWRSFACLTLFIVCRSAVYVGLAGFLPLFCIDVLGTSKAVAGSTLSVLALSGVFFTFLGGPLADRFGYVRMIRWGSLLLVPAVVLAILSNHVAWVFALVLPISLAFNITYSPFVVLGQTYLAKSVGFASGVTLGISFSAGGIIAPALGRFGDLYGISVTMWLLALLALLALLTTFLLRQPAAVQTTSARQEKD